VAAKRSELHLVQRATASLLGPSKLKASDSCVISMGPPAEMIPGPDRAASSCVELRRQLGWAGTGQRARLGLARDSHLEGDPSRRRRGVAVEFRGEE
jgi:DNA-binding transcriptional regulator YdaS (Cro superfamily)